MPVGDLPRESHFHLQRKSTKNPDRMFRNNDQDIQRSGRYLSEFEYAVVARVGGRKRHTFPHEPNMYLPREVRCIGLENLTQHRPHNGFLSLNLEIHIEAACVKNDLNSRSLSPGARFCELFTAIEHKIGYERFVVVRIFDQLKFEDIRTRPVSKVDGILIEYRAERIPSSITDYP